MDRPDRQNQPQHRSQHSHSIPLQDLPRPPEGGQDPSAHRRTLSARLLGSTYAPLDEDDEDGTWNHDIDPSTGRPVSRDRRDRNFDDRDFNGSFNGAGLQPGITHGSTGLGALLGQNDSELSLASINLHDDAQSSPLDGDSDRAPLTNSAYIQPIDGAATDQARPSLSIRSRSPAFASPGRSRLGDELNVSDLGGAPLSPGKGRSSSVMFGPSSALGRASTVVRKMSQRVVNVSNEPQLVEQEIRRRSSQRKSDLGKGGDPETDLPRSPVSEKSPHVDSVPVAPAYSHDWVRHANPLRGKSMGIFPPENKLRTTLCDFLTNPFIEPAILAVILLQTVLLAVQDAPDYFNDPESENWNNGWIDYVLFALFVLYTFEIAIKVIVSGFVVNPVEYSTINRGQEGFRKAFNRRAKELFALEQDPDQKSAKTPQSADPLQPALIRAFTMGNNYNTVFAPDERQSHRIRLAKRAFLRHSFNRLDFVAVVSYWIAFAMSVSGFEEQKHIHVFRMMSCLRILRLLSLTSGTSMILRSLKKAAPLLLNVALLIGFFWLVFAIIGVQSFKSSLTRSCVWTEPGNPSNNYTTNQYGSFQFCGGSVDINGVKQPWLYSDGTSSNDTKGYLCPPNSVCVSGQNPYNGTVSFDNVFNSLELVFVIITSNTFTDIMYYTTDSDYLPAAIYFAFGIVILTFWVMNLLIAVITTSLQVIRDESNTSAFSTEEMQDKEREAREAENRMAMDQESRASVIFDKTYWLWILMILYDLVVMCLRSAAMSQNRENFINDSETVVTFLLLLEILLRFAVDWRGFFYKKRNWVDLGLAVITTIIQIPPIRNSGQPYAWLTIFQILRIYRLVLAVPFTRDLLLLVLGKTTGLLNLILFVFLLTFLVAIMASELFRGELPQGTPNGSPINVTFNTIFNSFLGMYQIFSSENWTTILYNITSNDVYYNTAWIGAIFLILWFILGYFIVLNMFIAVIQENFDVSEDEKRMQQVKAFLQQKELGGSSHGTLSLSSMFKLRSLFARRQDPLDFGPAMTEMLLEDAVVKDFLDDHAEQEDDKAGVDTDPETPPRTRPVSGANPATLDLRDLMNGSWYKKLHAYFFQEREVNPFYTRFKFDGDYADLDPQALAREVVHAAERRKIAQREYLNKYPNYNKSLFLFNPTNPIRRACQKLVGPSRGTERVEGTSPSPILLYAFSAFLYASIIALVILACVTTPLFQKNYWRDQIYSIGNWFVFTDMAFAVVFTIESAIRIIADGFFWTPNAYFRSTWGIIDGVVLITLWINVLTSLYNQGAVSRAVGAFKALRALRLLNVSDSARNTFHSVIVLGGWKVLSAAFVSISLLIPFAIYGLNLFNGQLENCNDGNSNIAYLHDCVNEYMGSPTNWNVLSPRVVSNSWYSFDNFGASLSILFQIVSQEGWVDVMWRAISITGPGQTLNDFNTYGNAVFFVVFNLLGAVFVLTLFVSVFMRNYTEQTGVAFLTTEQRSWLELRNLLRQVSPSKRPPADKKRQTWQDWCYRRAIRKSGNWQRVYTCVLVVHLILLCTEYYPEPKWWADLRLAIFAGMTVFYVVNIVVRIVGLTWTRFRKSSWDLYSLIVVSATSVMTIVLFTRFDDRTCIQIHKLLLVSIVFLLIPRNNQLDQLFKTAAASLPAIGNLLATWFVLFLVYAIALTQTFSLTRFSTQETDNLNFRDVPKALIVLFRCSVGEGWDQIMQDYASVNLPFCTEDDNFLNSDCGSAAWAKTLFISWNILSMYIFVNLFISLIFESFSYVYQRTSGLSAIRRRDIRKFKQAWSEYDPDGTGFISKENFPRFLGELSGPFDMSVYPENYKVQYLKQTCGKVRAASSRYSAVPLGIDDGFDEPRELDLYLVNERLRRLPKEEVQMRRARLNNFYEEVMVSADPDRGISFTSLLLILAHYKVISDNKSLRLEEYLRRRARLQRVEQAVRRGVVIGFFETLFWRRRFRKHMANKQASRMTEIPSLSLPEIYVDDHDDDEPQQGMKKPSLSLQIPGSQISTPIVSVTDPAGEQSHASGIDPFTGESAGLRRRDSIQMSPAGPGRGFEQPESSSQWTSFSPTAKTGSPSKLNSPGVGPSGLSHVQHPSSPSRDSPSSRGLLSEQMATLEVLGGGSPSHARGLSADHARGGGGGSDDGSSQGGRGRANSNVSAQDLMNMIDNSAWGESMRRSFTTKGPVTTKKAGRTSTVIGKRGSKE